MDIYIKSQYNLICPVRLIGLGHMTFYHGISVRVRYRVLLADVMEQADMTDLKSVGQCLTTRVSSSLIIRTKHHGDMVELADTHGLGPCGKFSTV